MTDFSTLLNPEQCAAATAGGGPLLVLAAAGPGKTRTLVHRVAYLVEPGEDPSRILLLTFTNRAAREMLDRAQKVVGSKATMIWSGTFHSICARLLRRYGMTLGYQPGFQILDEEDQKKLIGEIKYAKSWYNTARKPIGKGKVVPVPKWLDWDLWQGPAPRTDFRDNIVHYNWHWFRRWGTGECGNNQVHFIDISRWLLDVDFPEEVVSTGGKYFMPPDQDWEWPDVHTATYKFPGNKIITWEGTCCVNSNPYMGLSTAAMVYGDNGSVLFTPGGSVVLYDPKGTVVKEWVPDGVSKDKQITNTDNRSGAGWLVATGRHIENFADAIRAADPLAARAHADIGTKSTFLSLAANVAQTTGETLKICPTTGKLLSGGEAAKLWSREYEKGWELV
jgi:predicted dehydrogenase